MPGSIEFRNVCFGYDERLVLKNLNLKIDKPGLYSIVGPNGVGKSTVIKCLNKIVEPQEGSILINGTDIEGLRYKDISPVVGYVPVFSNDVFSMNVVDTILVGRFNFTRTCSREQNLKKVYEAMELLKIDKLAYRKFNQISAGQHQKVAIARGLVQETPILLLDEPTANLDVKYQVYVMELLRAIAEECQKIIITISHDLNITAKYSHQVIMMSRPGTVYAVGSPDEVLTEENIEKVYNVKCRVIVDNKCVTNPNVKEDSTVSVPHIILGEAYMDEDDEDL